MQGVIKSYDPSTGDGSVVSDTTLAEFDLASDALEGSIFPHAAPRAAALFSTSTIRVGLRTYASGPKRI
jgi:hypothetical protein